MSDVCCFGDLHQRLGTRMMTLLGWREAEDGVKGGGEIEGDGQSGIEGDSQ